MDACAFNSALLTLITRAGRISHSLLLLHLPSTCDSSGILDFYSAFSFHDFENPKGWSFHHQLSASSARPPQQGRASRRSSTTEFTTRRSLSISSKEFFFLDFYSSGDWILAFALLRNIPPRPNLPLLSYLFFLSFLAKFAFFSIATHTSCGSRAINCSRMLSQQYQRAIAPIGAARNQASERASEHSEYVYGCQWDRNISLGAS